MYFVNRIRDLVVSEYYSLLRIKLSRQNFVSVSQIVSRLVYEHMKKCYCLLLKFQSSPIVLGPFMTRVLFALGKVFTLSLLTINGGAHVSSVVYEVKSD